MRNTLTVVLLAGALLWGPSAEQTPVSFNRIALFPLHLNKPDGASAAEIVAGTTDGKTVLYADSVGKGVGFVDIQDPSRPQPAGYFPLEHEPTSLAVHRNWALVAVDKDGIRGELIVLDTDTRTTVARHALPGQPDAVAVSPDGRFAAITIENESGDFPSAPPGSLAVIRLDGEPPEWKVCNIELTGIDCLYPEDPEPEYVDINDQNIAVVSLQENNHIVLVDLEKGEVVGDFTAGEHDLKDVDLHQDKQIRMTDTRESVPREPDSVVWCSEGIVTADEGDLHGGTRSATLYDEKGAVKWCSRAQSEQIARDLGHYPDSRSEERGTEPEALKSARLGDREYIFIGCERSNLVLIYRVAPGADPKFVQALPSGPGPESVSVIEERSLVLAGAEVDFPDKEPRAYLHIYQLGQGEARYPSIRSQGISWCALSGLAASPSHPDTLFTLTDKALKPARILVVDCSKRPALIKDELLLDGAAEKYDLEGISTAAGGGFWLVSEGKVDALIRTDEGGKILEEISLPPEVEAELGDHGMEGVIEIGAHVYVAFQSHWRSDREPTGHLGRYSPTEDKWEFANYPREKNHYATGLAAGPDGSLILLLRDKMARENAKVKQLIRFSLEGFESGTLKPAGSIDLLPHYSRHSVPVPEKPEGVAFDGRHFWVVEDNDAMKDSYGETHLIRLDGRQP